MARIKRIGVLQTTKFFMLLYLIMSLVLVLPILLITLLVSGGNNNTSGVFGIFGGVFMIFIPVLYALGGGLMVAIMSLFYNLVAKIVGGVELEVEEDNKTQSQAVNQPNPQQTPSQV